VFTTLNQDGFLSLIDISAKKQFSFLADQEYDFSEPSFSPSCDTIIVQDQNGEDASHIFILDSSLNLLKHIVHEVEIDGLSSVLLINQSQRNFPKYAENSVDLLVSLCIQGKLKEVIQFVKKNGPNLINKTDSEKRYPIFTAIQYGHEEIVEFLIKNKANLKLRDEEGMTALDVALMNNNADIANLLVENGAKQNHEEDEEDEEEEEDNSLLCTQCKISSSNLLLCSGCHIAKYCSANCQKIHWKIHKKDCKSNKK